MLNYVIGASRLYVLLAKLMRQILNNILTKLSTEATPYQKHSLLKGLRQDRANVLYGKNQLKIVTVQRSVITVEQSLYKDEKFIVNKHLSVFVFGAY